MPVLGRRGGVAVFRRIVGSGSGQAPTATVSFVRPAPAVAFLLLESSSTLLIESGSKVQIET